MTALTRFLDGEIEAGTFPGAAALVGTRDGVLEDAVRGQAAVEPEPDPVRPTTLFDLASLTKPLCTTALVAAAGPALPLDSPPGRFLPEWKKTRFDGITLEHLLTHTAGLAAWYPLYVRGEGAAAYRRTIAELDPDAPPGRRVLYSDLGILVLTQILEQALAAPLDRAFDELVARPTGSAARFLPRLSGVADADTAATERGDGFEKEMTEGRGLEYPRFRSDVIRGEVHDGNAHRRGGVSGHAGLFATARDVWLLARSWLDPERRDFTRDRTAGLGEARGLGWQGARGAGSAVPEMSPASFGHTGFTGTSLWLDPDRGLVLVLLTNRIHPKVREIPFNEARQRFHRAALEAFG